MTLSPTVQKYGSLSLLILGSLLCIAGIVMITIRQVQVLKDKPLTASTSEITGEKKLERDLAFYDTPLGPSGIACTVVGFAIGIVGVIGMTNVPPTASNDLKRL